LLKPEHVLVKPGRRFQIGDLERHVVDPRHLSLSYFFTLV